MALAIGLAMIFAALLIGRVAKTGGRMKPPPRWNNENLNSFIVVPVIVTLLAGGVATDWDWAAGRGWRGMPIVGDFAALVAVLGFLALWRLVTAWQRSVLPAEAAPAPRAEPTLKKAA
jgi:hypothetical protein